MAGGGGDNMRYKHTHNGYMRKQADKADDWWIGSFS